MNLHDREDQIKKAGLRASGCIAAPGTACGHASQRLVGKRHPAFNGTHHVGDFFCFLATANTSSFPILPHKCNTSFARRAVRNPASALSRVLIPYNRTLRLQESTPQFRTHRPDILSSLPNKDCPTNAFRVRPRDASGMLMVAMVHPCLRQAKPWSGVKPFIFT